MRRDPITRCVQAGRFCLSNFRWRAKICQRYALRMSARGDVQGFLQLGYWEPRHQDVERATAKITAPPKMRQKILTNDQMIDDVRNFPGVGLRELLIETQQGALSL